MTSRARIRTGRSVSYNPTAAEVTANGEGPWPALITDVDADGAVDLLVHVPGDALGTLAAALADPLHTETAIAAFTDPPTAGEMALLRTFVNSLQADLNLMGTLVNQARGLLSNTRKTAVQHGSGAGRYTFAGEGVGPQSV